MPEKIKKTGITKPKETKEEAEYYSKIDKEKEIERLLKAEEDAAYERLEKQGMSDQGIVSPEELVEFGKDVYKGAKKGVKKIAGKVKEVVGKVKEKLK